MRRFSVRPRLYFFSARRMGQRKNQRHETKRRPGDNGPETKEHLFLFLFLSLTHSLSPYIYIFLFL